MSENRRRGPKPKGPFQDKRRTLTTRITEETRSRLDLAAAAAGRSLAQEIELRLEQSFVEATYSPEVAALAELIARAMEETGKAITTVDAFGVGASETNWFDDGYCFDQALKAALCILHWCRPPGSRKPRGPLAALEGASALPPHIAHGVGKATAEGLLEAIRGRQPGIGRWRFADRVRDQLGTIGRRLSARPAAKAMMIGPGNRG